MLEYATALLLILVPLTFNLAFFALGAAFDYPDILRKEPDEILRRFHAGGSGLVLRWEALLLSAVGMLPLVALTTVVFAGGPVEWTLLAIVLGTAAAIVQAIGLVRWPFAVPELARRYVATDAPDLAPAEAAATRRSIEITFVTMHRLLGVGIGEHLGYLLTGMWTIALTALIVSSSVVPAWLGWLGLPIGVGILFGALEFVGPNEPDGWSLAGGIVPIAYIAWSIWLIVLGVFVAL